MATNSVITKVTGTDSSSNRVGSTFYGTCTDAAKTAAKTVVLADKCVFNNSCLVTGVTIHVKFTNSNTYAKPTLQVSNASPKPIMAHGTTYVGTTPETSWYAGAVVSFTYDGTYWVMNDYKIDIDAIISAIYPIGSIYMSVNNVNPGTYLTGTTWEAWGAGRVPVGVDPDNFYFYKPEATGGEATVTLTAAQSGVPAHTHQTSPMWAASSGSGTHNVVTGYPTTNKAGSYTVNVEANTAQSASQAHNNLQPYITCYMWKRTA